MALPTQLSGEATNSSEITEEAVRHELQQILESRHFRSSKRSQQFLQHVVEQKLHGNEDLIKERLIGIELFGRDSNYVTGDDPVVRVQAGDVRRRLERYEAELHEQAGVQIELPTGTYVPVFGVRKAAWNPPQAYLQAQGDLHEPRDAVVVQSSETSLFPRAVTDAAIVVAPPLAPLDTVPVVRSRRYWSRWLLVAAALVAGLVGGYLLHTPRVPPAVKKFWGPVFASPKQVVIHLGKPFVYAPSARLFDEYAKSHPGTFETGVERHNQYLPLDNNETIKWGDLIPVGNSGPAVGGVRASVALTSFLAQYGKPISVRFGEEGSFLEMRDSPAVVLGAMNNHWTMELENNFHFRIRDNNTYQYIEEAETHRVWKAEYSTANEAKDYGLITRLPVGGTGHFLLKIAGLQDVGTEAATELVTNPEMLQGVVSSLPKNWQNKNLQILIETNVIGRRAGPPHVLAVYVW